MGRFITFEGGEGGGKSTQIRLLSERLRKRDVPVLITREPGGCPLAERVRELLVTGGPHTLAPETELLLMLAARAQHLKEVIRPALASGTWVLCDRFSDSTLAYQGFGRGVNPEIIVPVGDWVVGDTRPELTIVLDLDPKAGLARSHARNHHETRFEQEALAFHQRVRQGFLALAKAEPQRMRVVDATPPPDVVAGVIWEVIRRDLLPAP